MRRFRRALLALLMVGSLGFLMGADGTCFFFGEDEDGILITDDDIEFF
jgi:hypothetical protein